jgi:hypothetical protein
MSQKYESLSGFWTGVYDYPSNFAQPVAFNGMIIDIAGDLSGEIIEPNTISNSTISEIRADINGERAGLSVNFIKTYQKVEGAMHQLRYEGAVDEKLIKIQGKWILIKKDGTLNDAWTGPFIMNRSINAAEEKIKIEESTGELLKIR